MFTDPLIIVKKKGEEWDEQKVVLNEGNLWGG